MTEPEAATLKAWIEAGAPQIKTEKPDTPRKFLSEADILREIAADLNRANERDRPYLRYFTLTHLYNQGSSVQKDLKLYRAAFSKLVNSLSWKEEIVLPLAIDQEETIYHLDLRQLLTLPRLVVM